VQSNGRQQEYLVVLGNLSAPNALAKGAEVAPRSVVGALGSTAVYLGVRLVRPGMDVTRLSPQELVSDATTVSVDPRNVLPPAPAKP
jgi:hypothetical protein